MEFTETDNVVVINSASKLFSMTGWRLGWVYGSVGAWSACCASTSTSRRLARRRADEIEYAAEAALRGDHGVVDEMTASFERRRDLLLDGFDEIGIDCPTPQGSVLRDAAGAGGSSTSVLTAAWSSKARRSASTGAPRSDLVRTDESELRGARRDGDAARRRRVAARVGQYLPNDN